MARTRFKVRPSNVKNRAGIGWLGGHFNSQKFEDFSKDWFKLPRILKLAKEFEICVFWKCHKLKVDLFTESVKRSILGTVLTVLQKAIVGFSGSARRFKMTLKLSSTLNGFAGSRKNLKELIAKPAH